MRFRGRSNVVHGLIPPHPAALLAVQAHGADIRKTVAYGLIVGVPTALIAGPLFALLGLALTFAPGAML